jgi:23S rRNA G2445 N2-methylase RlmL
VRYRFALTERVSGPTFRAVLEGVRQAAARFGWEDSPSRYIVELLLDSAAHTTQLFIRPTFEPDERFGYRVRDVPAAINPVIAACLARLAYTGPRARVLDPTCGSATLLIERALLERTSRLWGVDSERGAVQAARENVQAAALEQQIELAVGNSMRPELWRACDEVLANLPFGVRTRESAGELEALYVRMIGHIDRNLSGRGRAVLYTSHTERLTQILRTARRLELVERRRIYAGGIWVVAHVVVRV